ncbi:MAG: two pore domain potassium channel family protein [Rhodospirillales bacterium]|nr:two pore domain potassium channel family protein [Rhodospirillales bacterium]
MLRQLLVGGAASVAAVAIHALVMTLVVRVAAGTAARDPAWPSLHLAGTMVATVLVLMLAHVLEVLAWAFVYRLAGAAPAGATVYFAFVNYTTLGYGDIVPAERWRLLGPMAAMNGVLMFGWSTAVIFEVLRKSLPQRSRAMTDAS